MKAPSTAPQPHTLPNTVPNETIRRNKSRLPSLLAAASLFVGVASSLPAQNCVQFVNCPTNRVEYACGSQCVPVTFNVSATNYCNPTNLSVVTDYPSGYCFPVGTTPVRSTAYAYGSGESNTCTFTVTVVSNCPPSEPCIDLHCPTNLIRYVCGSNWCSPSHPPYTLWAQNLCSTNRVSITTAPAFPYCFPLGTTWVNVTATSGGQSVQCSFPVTVLQDPNCGGGGSCSPNLLVNGSFETPGIPDGYVALTAGDSIIPGWVTALNGIEWFNPWVAPLAVNSGVPADGNYMVELTPPGNFAGGIRQTFSTVAGMNYNVSFAMGTSKERGRNGNATIIVTVGEITRSFSMTTESPTIVWERKEFSFPAVSGSSTLLFCSIDDSATRFVNLDDVQVSDCPVNPELGITRTVTVEWKSGILQSGPTVNGPYADVPGAVSPYTVPAAGLQQYFRTQ